MGVWSNLKSPVWTMRPTGVSMMSASASGIEWLTATKLKPKRPSWMVSPSATWRRSGFLMPASASLPWIMPSVSLAEMMGTRMSRSRRRYGRAPVWSS